MATFILGATSDAFDAGCVLDLDTASVRVDDAVGVDEIEELRLDLLLVSLRLLCKPLCEFFLGCEAKRTGFGLTLFLCKR